MTAPVRPPSDDDMARSWREVHRPDWPDLRALQDAAVRFGIVRARAFALANGHHAPAPMPVTTQAPAAAPSSAPTPVPHRRRHDAGAFDPRMAAAGEFLHPDE